MMMNLSAPSLRSLLPSATKLSSRPQKLMKPVRHNPFISKNKIVSRLGFHAMFPSDLLIHVNKSSTVFPAAIHNSSGDVGVEDLQEEEEEEEEEEEDAKEEQRRNMMIEESLLAAGLRRELMPKHVGILPDGNMRWAKKHNMPLSDVHSRTPMLVDLCHQCIQLGIPVLTSFVFSTQNFSRPKMEVDYIMYNYEKCIRMQLDNFMKEDIKVSFIGDIPRLPIPFQQMITEVEEVTRKNTRLHVIYGMGYGGHYDITQACQTIAQKAKDGLIQPEQINDSLVEQHLKTNTIEFPCPDLVIRAGGDFRLSNFMMWQTAYTEFVFVKTLWPEFGETEFIEALRTFQGRSRTLGLRAATRIETYINC